MSSQNPILQDFRLSYSEAIECNDSVEMIELKLAKALEHTERMDLQLLLSSKDLTPYQIYIQGRTAYQRTADNIMRELQANK